MAERAPDDRPPFVGFISDHRQGRTATELTEALHNVTEAVRATGKPGSVTLTIAIQPLKDAEDVLKVTDTVKSKVPELARPAAIYFADRDGNLVRDNPRQPGLFEARALDEAPAARVIDGKSAAAGERE